MSELPDIVVLHRSVPGPRSADPVDRAAFRRLLDLSELDLGVTLVPLELLPEGGAPAGLGTAGVRVSGALHQPAARRLADTGGSGGSAPALMLTSLLLPRAVRDAVLAWSGPVIADLDRLASWERELGRRGLRPAEQPGIDTEIAHLRSVEDALLDRADLVLASDAGVARALAGRTATVVQLLAPSAAPAGIASATHGSVVVPGRFGAEWATPDETALATLPAVAIAAGLDLNDVVLAPEDTVPALRAAVHRRLATTRLAGSAEATRTADVALDLRPHGVSTTARRHDLSAAGVPWVASLAAVGEPDLTAAVDSFGELARTFVVSDDDEAGRALRLLLEEPDLRAEVAKVQLAATATTEDAPACLGTVLEELGLRSAPLPPTDGRSERIARARLSEEYVTHPRGGTLAAADPRIEDLEAEMVPLRLFDRETSIDLQSALDPDARYRNFDATHLGAPPSAEPAADPVADEVFFSVLVPTYDTDPGLLEECIASVAAQRHRNWELCLVDDGSPSTAHHQVLARWAEADPRVRVRLNPWNQGIALATNDALAMALASQRETEQPAQGTHFVVLLDHDDVLKPDALAWVARYATRCPDVELWYSDEDKILLDGRLGMPFFKPDWSPDLLMGVNYVCHLLAVRAELMEHVGGFRSGFDGAQDYDLVLRLVDAIDRRGTEVGHIAKPLYSWRMIPGSTALDTGEKPAAHGAGHRALTDALARRFEPATVHDGLHDTTHRLRYAVDTEQLLTVAIPTRDRVDLLERCIDRLTETAAGIRLELLVIDNDSADPATLAYLEDLRAEGHQVVRYPHEFSFARQINLGMLHARGDLVLVLNNDTWARNDDWLLRMMEHAQRPEVGLVGCKLMFPDDMRGGRPQHEGIVMGMAGLAYNIDLGGYMGMDQFVRDTAAVTAAAVMLRPSVFLGVGGMEERLRVAYNDVDFGLRVGEWGYRVVYTPHAVLDHPESASRGDLHPGEDEQWLVGRWGSKDAVRDPFVNPHFEWLLPVFYRL